VQHQLNDELVAALAATAPDEERLRQATDIMRGDPDGVRVLLGAVATDRTLAAAVAPDSYWHANGFAKLTLDRCLGGGGKLRMHIWTDGPTTTAATGSCNTHTHRWEFSSLVLCGALSVEEFEEMEDGDLADPLLLGCRKLVYDSPEAGIAGALRPLGDCLLRSTESRVYRVGDVHNGTLSTIHRVAPAGRSMAATLFVQGPSRVPSAFVYEEPGAVVIEDTGTAIAPADVMALVDLVLSTLPSTRVLTGVGEEGR
jgi:hypothetical protein